MNVFKAAVIGVGKAGAGSNAKGGGHQIGYGHGMMYQRVPRTQLVAAADINAENLAAFQEKFAVERGFSDHRKMLAEVRPDIVSLCTYVGLHRGMIEDCARAGVKGILCEKPFLPSPADCAAVRRVAAETGVKIVVAHFRRNRLAFRRARDLYNDGTIGQPVLCVAGVEGWDLSEWGSHWLDMFRFFHRDQPIRWVFGQARVRDFRGYGHAMEEHAIAYFEFENGGKGFLDGGRKMAGDQTMTLLGTEGQIQIFREAILRIDAPTGRRVEDFSKEASEQGSQPWDRMLEDLIAWLEGGTEPELGLTNMLKTSELNLAAYISAVRGDRVDLPLRDELAEWPVEILARRNTERKQ